ncbi:MAG: hypothetical protein LLG06_00695 [Desulfobacteraceae bacterium]|nr:hypothetical protein [Desulfobacteraceae bacterium]
MQVQPVSAEKFLQAYGSVLVQTWADPDFKKRFKADPGAVLKEFGLDPGDAKVRLLPPRDPSNPSATQESQVELWNLGLQTGEIQFIYPEDIPEGVNLELTDAQLEAIAGGNACCCCSCTPCCSCS